MISCHGVYTDRYLNLPNSTHFMAQRAFNMSFFLGQQNVRRVTKAFKYVLYEGTLLKNSTRSLTTASACERSSPWRSGIPPRELGCRVPGVQIVLRGVQNAGKTRGDWSEREGSTVMRERRNELPFSFPSLVSPLFLTPINISP